MNTGRSLINIIVGKRIGEVGDKEDGQRDCEIGTFLKKGKEKDRKDIRETT